MGLDQDLYALYDNGVECCIEMYRKNYLLRCPLPAKIDRKKVKKTE